MRAFTTHRGLVAPLDRVNVDTDQIIPKQFLKSIARTGFGDNLFDAWRYRDEGAIGKTPNERTINRDFVLNAPEYQGATVLLARDNFGCGSSREHAVWALLEYGFRCVIAPSFADIFSTNSVNNGLLLVTLPGAAVDALFASAQRGGLTVEVDLAAGRLVTEDGGAFAFETGAETRRRLLRGLDDIGLTLDCADAIRDFERAHRGRQPWTFGRPAGDAAP